MAQTIFERYGGFASVRRVVSSFYDRVLDSPALARHFETVDMRTLIDHQTKFIAQAMGGPASYTDEHLRRVHARLGIGHEDFIEMARLLRETLEDFDFDPADVDAVDREILRREHVIVTHVPMGTPDGG